MSTMRAQRLVRCLFPCLALVGLLSGCGTPERAAWALVEPDLETQAADLSSDATAQGMLHQSEHHTVNVLRVVEPLGLRRHESSDHTLYVIRGAGTLQLTEREKEVNEGDLVFVPRNTMYGFTPSSGEPVVLLSVFTSVRLDGDEHTDPLN
jgi:quercetin dioxygenase-like cupin family protein